MTITASALKIRPMSHLTEVDHPLVQHYLTLMRQKRTRHPQFKVLLGRIAPLLVYEAIRDLPLTTRKILTPVTAMDAPTLVNKEFVLVSILRAGNGLLEKANELIPFARTGFIGLTRNPETLQPEQYCKKLPNNLATSTCILLDPMLATGNSSVLALTLLKEAGAKDIRLVCLVAAPEGVKKMKGLHPDVPIFTAAMDSHLNEHGYIVPGLGDAGDRIFGTEH